MQTTECKEINKLDHVVTNNIKKNNNENNGATEYEPRVNNKFSLASGSNYPLTVVTVILIGGKKQTATTIAGLTFLWDSRNTDRVVKRKRTKNNKHKMRSNKVKCSTAAGPYCTTHDVKVTFCLPDVYSSKITLHRFYADNNKGKLGI